MVKDLSEDNKFKDSVLNEIKNKTISKLLFALRCQHNLTQKQIADKIGCTQSKISKIESSYDKDITINDLLEYGKSFNLQLEIGYRRKGNIKIVDSIKHHAFKIKEYSDMLAKLAGNDVSMKKGVLGVFCDIVDNMFRMIQDSASKLNIPKSTKKTEEPIHISSPVQDISGKTKEKVGSKTFYKSVVQI